MKHIGIIFLFIFSISVNAQQVYHRTVKLMGSRFDISVVANSEGKGELYINMAVNEISRIENMISSWNKQSQCYAINTNAGVRPVKVDAELFDLIKRSKTISKLTDGAFDISYASMDKIWKFDGSITEMPSIELINESVQYVDYHNIILDTDQQTVYLKNKRMKIGFGAIGKGYAADKAKALLVKQGVSGGVINASGDMSTWGMQANGKAWTVAITNPFDKAKSYGIFPISNGAVVTSGSYEKFIMLNGKRYSHIIDPRTGMPSEGIVSVTVFAPKTELADALATAVFVMGEKVGIDRINQLPKIECIIIKENGDIIVSKNIKIDNSLLSWKGED